MPAIPDIKNPQENGAEIIDLQENFPTNVTAIHEALQ